MKQHLSPEQQQIVDQWLASNEPMLVEAAAGSGKTRVLTEAVRTIIANTPKSKSKILCLTFTNKAAEEMAERLKEVSKVKERVFIGTIHTFALDLIKYRWHELGMEAMPTILDKETDRKEMLKAVILANPPLSKHYLSPPATVFDHFKTLADYQADLLTKSMQFISKGKQQLIWLDSSIDSYSNTGEWTDGKRSLYKDYTDLLGNQHLIDYDDIILLAWKILSERPVVAQLYRKIYEYVIVDEAQDLNFAQYELIRAICGNKIKKIMMVGDPSQAIHGYAGASSKFMTDSFVKDFSVAEHQRKKIQFNYRSSTAIIDVANELANIQQNTVVSYYAGKVAFLAFDDEIAEATWVLSQLHKLLNAESERYDGQLSLDKIAILARNRFVFNAIIKQLNKDTVLHNKFFFKKGTELLDPQSTTMKVFDLGTRILCNPKAYLYYHQLRDVLEVSNDVALSLDNSLEALTTTLSKSQLDYIPQSVFDCLIKGWQCIERDVNSFFGALTKILEVANSSITEDNEKALILHDIQEWQVAWENYVRSVASNTKSLNDFRRYLAIGLTQSNTQEGLTLATVHAVKGLEFYVVFLVGMGQGTFPDYRAVRKGNVEEEKNNAYVAVTRAKRELYITYPKRKQVPWGIQQQNKSEFFNSKIFLSLTDYEQVGQVTRLNPVSVGVGSVLSPEWLVREDTTEYLKEEENRST